MFIGKEGSGKSSTLDGLMGLHFKEGKDSTTLAEQKSLKYEWIKSEKGKGIWTQHSNDDEKNELAKLSCRAASKSDKSQSSTSSNTENEPTINEMKTTEGESTTDLEDIPTSEVESDATAEAHYNEHTDEISKKAMQQDIEENSSCESLDVLHVWDCGGQPVFLDILSVFITIRTFFLLFFNASEDIHAPCEESVWRHKSQQFTGRKRNITNIQLLIQWMQLIYGTVSVSQKQAHLSIMVVGTHGDKITSNKDTVLQSIELACRGKAFSKIASKGVIVNNTTAGTEVEDPGYGIIRKNAHAFAKELTTPTPLTWISFRLMVLKTIKEKGKRLYKLSKEKVTEIANSCNITNVDSVLEFYHQLGVFLYFPQSSPATVFVDPHWLFQQLCQLLIPDPSSIAQQNLTMYGILSSDMYQKVSKHCGLGEETLVEILDEFDLAKKIPVSQAPVDMTGKKLFFVPCMLGNILSAVEPNQEHIRTATLHIIFRKMGCVPPGFFIRLAALMAESDLFQLHFKRYGKIFRDFIPYKYHECFEVTIFEPPSIHSIHVDVAVHNHYRKSLADTCQSLRKDLYRMCKTACNRWLPTIEPHFAFICEKHNNEKDEEYFTSLDVEEGNKDTLVCESCSSPVNTTEEYNYWLSPQPLNTVSMNYRHFSCANYRLTFFSSSNKHNLSLRLIYH